MRFVSHRGAGGLAQENTLHAVKIGDSFAPEYIEVDIHRTNDGVFVLYHGDMKRNYLGAPLEDTLEELKSKVPNLITLEGFMQHDFKSNMLFDIKVRNSTDELVQILKKWKTKKFAFTSPHIHAMKILKNAFPKSKFFISQPFHEGPFRPIQLARKYDFTGVSLNKWWLGPYPYYACRRSNLECLSYTVDRSLTMRFIAKIFPHVLVVTNHPDRHPLHLLKKQNRINKI